MGVKISLERAVNFTKLSVYLAYSWPPSRKATKWETAKFNAAWYLSLLSCLGLFFPLLVSIYEHHSNSIILTQSACFLGANCNFIVKMIVYKVHRKKTQALIDEMEDFLKTAQPHERTVLQRYVDRCSPFHVFITFVNYLTTAMVICGPLLLPQPFPTNAVYPFSVDSALMIYLIYIHQSFVGFQCSTGATIDCQIALMMWFASARLEILADEIKYVTDVNGFRNFVCKHQRLLRYAEEVSYTMCYIAMTTSAMSGIGTIFSSLQLFGNQPFAVKMQFGPVALIATMNLFVCAWPADNMIRVCDMMGKAVYDTSWVDMSPRMTKNFLLILRRSQRPITVSLGGFISALSLRSYASYLSTAVSYTTTLRLVINSDAEG